jgi:putative hydrolase of the HAD superfamily
MANLPRAILFDLDDTILVAFGPAESQWQRILGAYVEHLAPLTPAAAITAIMGSSRDLWADPARHKHWRHRIGEARRRIVAGAFDALAADGHAVPGRELCDEVADRFVRLALITNGAAAPQRAKVVRFALEHRFDHIQIEGEHGFGKPEERAYTHAMAALGVTARDTWMVGDNLEWEVAAPQRLGIHAIWHDGYGTGLPPDCPVRPDRIIRRLSELLP